MSEQDQQFIAPQVDNPKKIAVVANGVDGNWFSQIPKKLPKDPTILFVGTFKWLPNREAVSFLVKQVWPVIAQSLPTAKLWIVGNAPSDEVLSYQSLPNVTVTGNIPDIRDAFAGAHMLLAPVLSGKGTRYKILEAMASATPIVATPTAVEGLGITPGKEALLGKTAQELAQKSVQLLTDTILQQKLAKQGERFVRSHFDWHLIAKQLDEVYRNLGQVTQEDN